MTTVSTAITEAAKPLAEAMTEVEALWGAAVTGSFAITYTYRGFKLRMPIGVRDEVVFKLINHFHGWGFRVNMKPEEAVRELVFDLPIYQTKTRHDFTYSDVQNERARRNAPKPTAETIRQEPGRFITDH